MRIFTSIISILISVSAFAQINGSGFYRVRNVFTDRYIHVMDNHGSISIGSMSADVEAIVPYSGFEKAASSPSSVIYIDEIPDNYYTHKYNFYAQGTNVHSIIDHYILLLHESDGTYRCYATDSGISLYLADTWDDLSDEEGALETVKASYGNTKAKKWYVEPITSQSDNYFGIKPTIEAGGKYYATFYAAFAFKTASTGMKVYKVSENNENMAVWEEIQGTVPAATPVVIECSSPNPSDNRIDWIAGSTATVGDNILKGNYFRNGEDYKDSYVHKNVTAYNASTMRVLGIMADGSLGFVTGSDKYLDANSAYLPIGDGVESELKLVTKAEYDEANQKPVYCTITYIIDGEVYETETYEVGSAVNALANPSKEGYTFSGWSEVPETMPNEDITVTGTFTVNSYTITYIVDGVVYTSETCQYGAIVTLLAEPEKEGYTFSGWSEMPETMPSEDITVTGTFTVNSYTITYIVDGAVYTTETYQYGAVVTPLTEPEKEGYNFSGWSEIPQTMPASDITVTGNFKANAITSAKAKGDNVVYNIMGVRLGSSTPLRSGIYIVNGKKVVVK